MLLKACSMDFVYKIRQELRDQSDPVRATHSRHYFKTEPGENDEFLGVTVPKQRSIIKKYFKEMRPKTVVELLHSTIHEERLTALIIWVLQFKNGDERTKKLIYELYLENTQWINNWDLVDSSSSYIVGAYVYGKNESDITKLSVSLNLWERRIAIIATAYFIKRGDFNLTLQLAEQYINDSHHYIQKATG